MYCHASLEATAWEPACLCEWPKAENWWTTAAAIMRLLCMKGATVCSCSLSLSSQHNSRSLPSCRIVFVISSTLVNYILIWISLDAIIIHALQYWDQKHFCQHLTALKILMFLSFPFFSFLCFSFFFNNTAKLKCMHFLRRDAKIHMTVCRKKKGHSIQLGMYW